MLVLSSMSSGLEFWSLNHTSIYENSKLKVFKNIKFLGINFIDKISKHWVKYLLGKNAYNTFESYW